MGKLKLGEVGNIVWHNSLLMTRHDRTQVPFTPTEKSLPQEKRYPEFLSGFYMKLFWQLKSLYVSTWLGKTFWKLHFDTANFNTTWKYRCVQCWLIHFLGFNLFPTRRRGPPEEQMNRGHCAGLYEVCYPRHLIVILFDLSFFHFHVDIYVCAYAHIHIYVHIWKDLTWIFGRGRSD